MNGTAVDVQAAVTRLADFFGANLFPRFETTLDRINSISVGFHQSFPPRYASAYRRDFRGKHPILVLEIVDLELLILFTL
jgi:hypothetical protein